MLTLYKSKQSEIAEVSQRYKDAYGISCIPYSYERLKTTVLDKMELFYKLNIIKEDYNNTLRELSLLSDKSKSIIEKTSKGEELLEDELDILNMVPIEVLQLATNYNNMKMELDRLLMHYDRAITYNDMVNEYVDNIITEIVPYYSKPLMDKYDEVLNLVNIAGICQLPDGNSSVFAREVFNRILEIDSYLYDNYANLLFLDTETTDTLKAGRKCLPVQVSYILSDNTPDLNILSSGNIYIMQDGISEGAISVHGLTKTVLNRIGAVSPEEAVAELHPILTNVANLSIAHNMSFDSKVINNLGYQTGKSLYLPAKQCTYQLSRQGKIKKDKSAKLEELVKANNIDKSDINKLTQELFLTQADYHNATADVAALYLLYKKNYHSIVEK